MGPTALRGIRATGDTLSNVESQVFKPYKFGSTAGDRTPNLLTTRPTCYHSATALCYNGVYVALQLFLVILVSDCSEGTNIGCQLDCLELVIVQPGSVILVIALPSLRHLVITHLSVGLAGQSL